MQLLNFIKKIFGSNISTGIRENITLGELKKLWEKEHYKTLSKSGITGYETAWLKCSHLHKQKFLDLKYRDWQAVIEQIKEKGLHYSSQKKARNLIGQLYKFAAKHELTDKNYAQFITLDKDIPVKPKEPFSEEEIEKLWNNKDKEDVNLVLILIYTGVRISELLRIKSAEDIFIDDRYFIVRQSKTEAGRNRPVPISKKIDPFIRRYVRDENQYLLTNAAQKKMSYTSFSKRFKGVMKKLNMNHTIHECRHTCATLLDNAEANELATRRILGHAANGVTKKVYTHKKIKDLIKAIDLI